MKLSTETIDILKNFAGINPNLVIKKTEDSTPEISTIAEAKNILAKAEVAENFPRDFGIYDLNEFLNIVSMFDNDSAFDFVDTHVAIQQQNAKCNYYYSDPTILTSPQKSISMPSSEVEVTITKEQLNQVRRAAGILGHTVASLRGNNGTIELAAIDPSNNTANEFSVVVDESNSCTNTFDLQFLISNLKVMSGDYQVELSSKLISHWTHTQIPVEYYIALEQTSTFEA